MQRDRHEGGDRERPLAPDPAGDPGDEIDDLQPPDLTAVRLARSVAGAAPTGS